MTTASSGPLRPMRNVTPVAAPRRKLSVRLHLWLPVSLLFLLLAPFAIAALPLLWLFRPLGRRNWAPALFSIGAALMALHGTRIEIRTPDANLSFELF